jgi:hypothetical protein
MEARRRVGLFLFNVDCVQHPAENCEPASKQVASISGICMNSSRCNEEPKRRRLALLLTKMSYWQGSPRASPAEIFVVGDHQT